MVRHVPGLCINKREKLKTCGKLRAVLFSRSARCAKLQGMMKRWTARLDANDVRALEEIGRERGGLSVSKVIRLAVAEYIANESKRMKAAREPLCGQAVGKPLWMDADAE